MSRRLFGIGASPGRSAGPAMWVHWDLPPAPHRTIAHDEVDREISRFQQAREWARGELENLRAETAQRVGKIEAKIFEPQILMLDDPDLVDGTISYIQENFLAAERAFDWRLLELRWRIIDIAHVMIVDRLADLQDIRFRVLSRLLGVRDRDRLPETSSILLFEELTPSFAVGLDPEKVLGLLTVGGTRASHSAVLARSMEIPAVVGIGSALAEIADETEVILDGGSGRIIVDPTEAESELHRRMVDRLSTWERQAPELAERPLETVDGQQIRLEANLDQPYDVEAATRVGAEGIGLFRSEFLVIGRRIIPNEDEQYEAYRTVVEAFPNDDVTLRTFDIGGDKFPLFLEMPPEENPYLGWRAIRVCLDLPDLFRNQLRAAVRASAHGRLRILLPFVISVDEIRQTSEILRDIRLDLPGAEIEEIPLGIMVETPAVTETLDLIAPHIDFVSLGTNDLTQYVLAVDRGNARLSSLSDPLHPALLRMYARVRETAQSHGLGLGVCGDLATDPVGVCVLLGLGYRSFSLPPSSIPEIREILRAVSAEKLAEICADLFDIETAGEIRAPIRAYLKAAVPSETWDAALLSVI